MNQFSIVAIILGLQLCNGQPEIPKELYPTIVKVAVFSKETGGEPRLVCDGSLLTERWVLTAAQCVSTGPGERLSRVMIGNHNPYYYLNILNVDKHDKYDPITGQNDVALIELDNPFNMKVEFNQVQIPSNNTFNDYLYESFFLTESQIASFWHRKDEGTAFLDHSSGTLILDVMCEQQLNRTKGSLQGRVCMPAGTVMNPIEAAEHERYIGGPALYWKNDKWVVMGVMVSSENSIIIYTEIIEVIDWIESKMGSLDALKARGGFQPIELWPENNNIRMSRSIKTLQKKTKI